MFCLIFFFFFWLLFFGCLLLFACMLIGEHTCVRAHTTPPRLFVASINFFFFVSLVFLLPHLLLLWQPPPPPKKMPLVVLCLHCRPRQHAATFVLRAGHRTKCLCALHHHELKLACTFAVCLFVVPETAPLLLDVLFVFGFLLLWGFPKHN